MKTTQSSSKKNIIIWAIIIIGVGGFIWGLSTINSGGNTVPASDDIVITTDGEQIPDHVKGNQESPIVLIEYSDFQCPACRSYFSIVKELMEERGEKIAFVYRHFPLSSIHRNAQLAAQATEAAGLQGKFWEMHDRLFENQNAWAADHNPRSTFEKYAEQLGLNVDQFKDDINSNAVRAKVQSDIVSARSAGSSGTPTFVLNGEKLNNTPSTAEQFIALIDQTISEGGFDITNSNSLSEDAGAETDFGVKKAE